MDSCLPHALAAMLLSALSVWICRATLVESREEIRGFSYRLVHRDAPSSLFRSSLSDTSDLPDHMPMKEFVGFGRALRSRQRLQSKRPVKAVDGSFSYQWDFYLTAKIGTPPQEVVYVLDTGSELIWMQCASGNKARTGVPVFQAARSSSYTRVPSTSSLCGILSTDVSVYTNVSANSCLFRASYGDGTTDEGYISVDTFQLGTSSVSLVFGCAETVETDSPGIMGLSQGPFSFSSQLLRNGYSKKFAYCLPDFFKRGFNASVKRGLNSSGVIQFGESTFSAKLMYTPLVPPLGPLGNMYYYVELTGISLGNHLLNIPLSAWKADATGGVGGTILDSGTTFTYLVESAYRPLVQAMRKATAHLQTLSTSNGTQNHQTEELCYKISSNASQLPTVPRITLHFLHGVNLEVEAGSIWYPLEVVDDGRSIVLCAGFGRSSSISKDFPNLIGNYLLQNYWVEYDLDSSQVGFAKTDCAFD